MISRARFLLPSFFRVFSGMIFISGLLILLVASLLFLTNNYGYGLKILVCAYIVFLIGLVTYFIEFKNAKK